MSTKTNLIVGDIVNIIDNIDLKTIVDVVMPLIIFKLTKNAVKSYKLHKEFNGENSTTVDLPPEIVRQHLEIDKEQILKQKFAEQILIFAEKIIEEMPDSNLTLFYNNINSLSTEVKNLYLSNKLKRKSIQAYYTGENNTIFLQEKNYLLTIFHELFHMASTRYFEDEDRTFIGFMQEGLINGSIGMGINEGYTQLMTERYFGETHKLLIAYGTEKYLAKQLENIVGQKKMESLYLNANLYGLIEELKQYNDEQSSIKFIRDVDFISSFACKKNVSPLERKMIISKVKDTTIFFANCFARKLKLKYSDVDIDNDAFSEEILKFVNSVATNITLNNKAYKFIEIEELTKIIVNVFNGTAKEETENDEQEFSTNEAFIGQSSVSR